MRSVTPATAMVKAGSVSVELITEGDRMSKGDFEPETLAYWVDRCREATGWALDVGAYSGIYTIAAAKAGRPVMAFEPNPVVFERLSANVVLNNVNATMMQCAASSRNGVAIMHTNPAKVLTSGGSLDRLPGDNKNKSFSVNTTRLDDAVVGLPISIIKMDVERHEPSALSGAQRILMQQRPILIVEVLGSQEMSAVERSLPFGYQRRMVLDMRNVVFTYE